jgi:hypothetical protein
MHGETVKTQISFILQGQMLKAKNVSKRTTKEHEKQPKTKCWPEAVILA